MKKKNLKIFVISLSLMLAASCLLNRKEHEHNIFVKEELANEPLYFRTCSAGDIYIGTSKQFIKYGIPDGIMVIDKRKSDNPDLVVSSSYEITSKQEICEILNVLQEYNELNPSEWNRSIESMKNEWDVHNLLHSFNISLEHTTDVDLDNEDEAKFNSKPLSLVLRNSKE